MGLQGIIFSVLFHAFLVLFLVVGAPVLFEKKLPFVEEAITVEIVPITQKSNIKNQEHVKKKTEKKQEPKKAEKQKEPEKKYTSSKPEPKPEPPKEVKKAEAKPEKAPEPAPKLTPEPKPEPKKIAEAPKPKAEPEIKVKPKPEPPKKQEFAKKKPEPKEEEDPFASVLRSVKKLSEEEKSEASEQKAARSPHEFDPDKQISQSIIGAIRKQVGQHWTVLSGARGAEDIAVKIRLQLSIDGTIQHAEIVEKQRIYTDPFYRAAADRALAAVKATQKLEGLPKERYTEWGQMTMTFDPKEML